MQPTSASLLKRIRDRPNEVDWKRLVDIYRPYIRHWLKDLLMWADADDLEQDILTTLVQKLPTFDSQGDGSFRCWLRDITINRSREWQPRITRNIVERILI